jgi:hypothetical protein
MKKQSWKLSEEALQEHISFLQKKDPSIIFKTCQMLSASKIISLPPKQAYPFILEVINSMRKDGKLPWNEERWGSFDTDSLDKFLPEILQKKEWVFSIKKYLRDKIMNALTVDFRRRKKQIPISCEVSNQEEDSKEVENPEIQEKKEREEITPEVILFEEIEINQLFDTAKLTEQQRKITIDKSLKVPEKDIASKLGLTRDVVKHEFKQATDKLAKVIKRRR